jgi:hypothetical protein
MRSPQGEYFATLTPNWNPMDSHTPKPPSSPPPMPLSGLEHDYGADLLAKTLLKQQPTTYYDTPYANWIVENWVQSYMCMTKLWSNAVKKTLSLYSKP